jgi:hypothetical protein
MKFTKNAVANQPEILKRRLGGELLEPITVVFGENVTEVKGGTPIAVDGSVATTTEGTSNAVGILLYDVTVGEPVGSLIKAFAVVNTANANANSGNAITDDVKEALPLIVFE